MEYVIWGAGERGARIFPHLDAGNVKAFIDIDESKIGKEYCGKKIITFEEYKKNYPRCYIILSYSHEKEVENLLKEQNIYKYFKLSECPGEFQESYPRDILKKYIWDYITKEKKYFIYGCTLYSIMVFEWIQKKTGIIPAIIPHKNISDQLLHSLKIEMPNLIFSTLEDFEKEGGDELLLTIEDELYRTYQRNDKKIYITNIYDCSNNIQQYFNPLIEKFKNIHKGKRCFIVATGPSLRIEDLNILDCHKEICISVNSIWKAFSDTVWRPRYYLAMDYRALRDWSDVIEHIDIPYLFLGDTNKEYWMKDHDKNHIKHHFIYEYTEKRYPKFSEDFSRGSYMGSTITYNAIQLAVYMGFQEIYLLGVDFSYSGGNGDKKYAHFYKEEKLTATGYEQQVFLSYMSAKKYADEHNIKIYNATRGGKLEVFERVDFDRIWNSNK